MSAIAPSQRRPLRYRLVPFDSACAPTIATWVASERELQWLAPSSRMPLTAAQVIGWRKPGGRAFVFLDDDRSPMAYGEVNPMRRDRAHAWLGHIVVAPERQGNGIGGALVRLLLDFAFDRLLMKRVSLVVFPGNEAAVRCYRRAGFQDMGEEYHQFGGTGPRYRLWRMSMERPS